MNNFYDWNERLKHLEKWRSSDAHNKACMRQQAECSRLIHIASDFLQDLSALDVAVKSKAVVMEKEVGGDIHRGFYCPSPILDIIVGNVHRGRILKRATISSKITHCFGFDGDGRLLYAETIGNGTPYYTEYIIKKGSYQYGITVNTHSELTAVSEECFEDQRLVRYCYINIIPDNNAPIVFNFHQEQYIYDECGLKSCIWSEYEPFAQAIQKYLYEFQREEGYLHSYTLLDQSIDGHEVANGIKYTVRLKRKA